jgi:transcriptional regulator with XRE-family HTH domain
MFWDKFVTLCSAKGISPNGVCADLGLSTATATKWKKGAIPRDTTLKKIADYFCVSTSYLLGVVDDPEPVALVDPSKKEPPMMEWLTKLDDMTPDELAEVEQFVDFVLSRTRKK